MIALSSVVNRAFLRETRPGDVVRLRVFHAGDVHGGRTVGDRTISLYEDGWR